MKDDDMGKLYLFSLKALFLIPVPSRPMVFAPMRPRVLSLLFLDWEKLICSSLGERPSPSDPIKQCIHSLDHCLSKLIVHLCSLLYCLTAISYIMNMIHSYGLFCLSFPRSIFMTWQSPLPTLPSIEGQRLHFLMRLIMCWTHLSLCWTEIVSLEKWARLETCFSYFTKYEYTVRMCSDIAKSVNKTVSQASKPKHTFGSVSAESWGFTHTGAHHVPPV